MQFSRSVRTCVLISFVSLCPGLPTIGADTCPPVESSLTMTALDGTPLGDNLYVAFDDSNCRYGPSNGGRIDLEGPCQPVGAAERKIPLRPVMVRTSEFRSTSLAPSEAPSLTVLLKSEDKSERNGVWRFLNSSAGAAILVALITGLFGTIITHLLQARKFQHELALQDLYKRAEQSRIRLSKELDDEREVVQAAYQLIGRCLAAADGLLAIATQEFQKPGPRVASAKMKLWSDFEETEKGWKTERYSTGLLVRLHHPGRIRIKKIWAEIDDLIAGYFEACKQRYEEFNATKSLVSPEQKMAIRTEHVEKVLEALERLTIAIAEARQSSSRDFSSVVVADPVAT